MWQIPDCPEFSEGPVWVPINSVYLLACRAPSGIPVEKVYSIQNQGLLLFVFCFVFSLFLCIYKVMPRQPAIRRRALSNGQFSDEELG
jgi:hypothetical protein